MSMVQQAIEVGAPLHAVYEQLAAFENYPRFMSGVRQVTPIGVDQTHWIMDVDGKRREFDAQITERSLDERVSWSTMEGPLLAETITLRPMGETKHAQVAVEPVMPLGPPEPVGDLLRCHAEAGIQLRVLTNLWPFWDVVITSTVGFSGIRLRNALPRP